MSTPVIMPKFGMAQEEGTIIRWLKEPGMAVEKGEVLLEVQTDKIDMEVEATASGILVDVRYGPEATVPVTTVIAQIVGPDEGKYAAAGSGAPTGAAGERRASPVAQRMAAASGLDLGQVAGSGPAGRITKQDVAELLERAGAEEVPARVRATPAARRLGRERGVSLVAVAGSGPAGRIQAVDVPSAVSVPAASSAAGEAVLQLPLGSSGEPLRGRRRVIAQRLGQSWQSAPHIFLTTSLDLTRADVLSAELGAAVAVGGGRLTPTVWIARAAAAALQRHPRLNAWLQLAGEQLLFQQHQTVHLGVAVAVADGLLVPVVRDAQQLGLTALAAAVGDLAQRARAGQMRPEEVSGATFTISNLGMYPVEQFTAILNPPEVAILAVGRAQMQPVWNGSLFEPRRQLQVTLSADHRAVDGAVAAAFLAELKELVEAPARLLL